MKSERMLGPRRMGAEAFAAAMLAIFVGVLVEWVFYLGLPVSVRVSLALVPFELSVLTFTAFPLFRWPRRGAPVGGIVLFTVIGLLATVAGSAVLLIMVGCHFNECINL